MDLASRAELLGLSCREYVELASRDSRAVAQLALDTAGSVARVRRWLAAGAPSVDLSRLVFRGADAVRALVVEVLTRAPSPVAWHGVEYVTWFEVGRGTGGWQSSHTAVRNPEGDQPHIILLSGAAADDHLISVVAHELGHSWRRSVIPFALAHVDMSDREHNARSVAAARLIGETTDDIVRAHVLEEQRADELATLWGFPRRTDIARLTRAFTSALADAAPLVDDIETDVHQHAARAAASA